MELEEVSMESVKMKKGEERFLRLDPKYMFIQFEMMKENELNTNFPT